MANDDLISLAEAVSIINRQHGLRLARTTLNMMLRRKRFPRNVRVVRKRVTRLFIRRGDLDAVASMLHVTTPTV